MTLLNTFKRILKNYWFVIGLFTPGVLLAGCGQKQELIRGVAPIGTVITVREVIGLTASKITASKITDSRITDKTANTRPNGRQVVLRGEMIEKCPIAGCWFKLRDATGVIKVDTKAAGFVVSDIPLHSQLTVQGSLVSSTQDEVAATGIRY